MLRQGWASLQGLESLPEGEMNSASPEEGAVMSAVSPELAAVEPASFDAVTIARTVWPTSAAFSLYEAAFAPEMFVQPLPEELQSCHW